MFNKNKKSSTPGVFYTVAFALLISGPAFLGGQAGSSEIIFKTIALKYISPDALAEELTSQRYLDEEKRIIVNNSRARLMINSATNQILLSGNAVAVAEAGKLIDFLDVAPRQIVIEAKIVEVDNEKMSALGMDWQELLDRTYGNFGANISWDVQEGNSNYNNKHTMRSGSIGGSYIVIGDMLKIIQENGAGRIVSVPKIVTTNNKKGTILDGYRINYVNKASGFANIYETQEMTAGLSLAVTPSLGESGYLKMDIKAKLTTLAEIVGGSPSELGQIIENTIIAKDGEEFLLGGFKKMESSKFKRKVPILGSILPFLFSRTVTRESTKDFLIILKPKVIDLTPPAVPEIE